MAEMDQEAKHTRELIEHKGSLSDIDSWIIIEEMPTCNLSSNKQSSLPQSISAENLEAIIEEPVTVHVPKSNEGAQPADIRGDSLYLGNGDMVIQDVEANGDIDSTTVEQSKFVVSSKLTIDTAPTTNVETSVLVSSESFNAIDNEKQSDCVETVVTATLGAFTQMSSEVPVNKALVTEEIENTCSVTTTVKLDSADAEVELMQVGERTVSTNHTIVNGQSTGRQLQELAVTGNPAYTNENLSYKVSVLDIKSESSTKNGPRKAEESTAESLMEMKTVFNEKEEAATRDGPIGKAITDSVDSTSLGRSEQHNGVTSMERKEDGRETEESSEAKKRKIESQQKKDAVKGPRYIHG